MDVPAGRTRWLSENYDLQRAWSFGQLLRSISLKKNNNCLYNAAIINTMTKLLSQSAAHRTQMHLRIAVNDRVLFDLAADALGTSRSEFMLSASRKMAEPTLMNRALFAVDVATWDSAHSSITRLLTKQG